MRPPTSALTRAAVRGLVILGFALVGLAPGLASAQEEADVVNPRSFPSTGYEIANDGIWDFYTAYGGAATFGEPISNEFILLDNPVQLFQRAALQVRRDGSVEPLQLAAAPLLPYTQLNGLVVPSADPVMALITPSPDQTSYPSRVAEFLRATVSPPFMRAYAGFTGTGTDDVLSGLAVLGMPTSYATADPNNPTFVYQRFQNGILKHDTVSGTTAALPLGEYFKAVLTGRELPGDLASVAAMSPLLGQYPI